VSAGVKLTKADGDDSVRIDPSQLTGLRAALNNLWAFLDEEAKRAKP
jgi:hypothetical protein